MGRHSIDAAIEGRFLTQWSADAVTLRTPVEFGASRVWLTRVDRTGSLTAVPVDRAWVRCTVLHTAREQAALPPNPIARWRGEIHIQLYAPARAGRGALTPLMDHALAIFDRKQFGGVSCQAGEPVTAVPEQQWQAATWRFRFYSDETSPD